MIHKGNEKMITYINDIQKKYENDLVKHLRAYNKKFTGETEFKKAYIYMVDDEKLIGAMTLSCFWDWATIGDVYYENIDVLKCLVQKGFELYKNQIIGVKFFSPVKDRFNDFLKIGFIHTKTLKNMGYSKDFYYADLYELKEKNSCKQQIIIESEAHDIYHRLAEAKFKAFQQKYHLTDKIDDLFIVALDQDTFVGGVSCDIYEDTIYISRLVVTKSHRGQDIGTHLMKKVEEEAKHRCIHLLQLGTCEFQAKDFYQKLGYEVVYERKEHPRGFKAFTLIKRI